MTTIFAAGDTPANITVGDSAGITVGLLFAPSLDGQITGVRYYRSQTVAGQQTAGIWNAAGTLLASKAFTGETASGWQEQALTTPLAVTAKTNYWVGVFMANGGYAVTPHGFDVGRQDPQGLVVAPYGAGVFTAGSSMNKPATVFNNNNYWADVAYTTPSVPQTLFPDAAPTVGDSAGDATNLPFGLRFTVSRSGKCYGIRWFPPLGQDQVGCPYSAAIYDGAGNQITQVAALDNLGLNLAGRWHSFIFTTPVTLAFGSVYTAVIWLNGAMTYGYTASYFPSPVSAGVITAPASSNGGNGVVASTTFPGGPPATAPANNTGSNYWIDPLIVPDPIVGGSSRPIITFLAT